MVYGIGSYTYQMNTRDTFGFAMKTTYTIIKGEEKMLYKNPKTDDGTKKSQRGLVYVFRDIDGKIKYQDGFTKETLASWIKGNDTVTPLLKTVFEDGKLMKDYTLAEIRKNIRK